MIFNKTDIYSWHDTFVLFPRDTVEGKIVWLQKCKRKYVYTGYSIDCCDEGGGHWEYSID